MEIWWLEINSCIHLATMTDIQIHQIHEFIIWQRKKDLKTYLGVNSTNIRPINRKGDMYRGT